MSIIIQLCVCLCRVCFVSCGGACEAKKIEKKKWPPKNFKNSACPFACLLKTPPSSSPASSSSSSSFSLFDDDEDDDVQHSAQEEDEKFVGRVRRPGSEERRRRRRRREIATTIAEDTRDEVEGDAVDDMTRTRTSRVRG